MTSAPERVNTDVWSSEKVLGIFAAREGFIDRRRAGAARRIAGRDRRTADPRCRRRRRAHDPPACRARRRVRRRRLPARDGRARRRPPPGRARRAGRRARPRRAPVGSFGAVFFSFNGIDGIAHEDSDAVHRAALRVLAPGGLYLLSTHNLEHVTGAGCRRWHPRSLDLGNGPRAMLACAYRMPQRSRSWRRLAPLTSPGRGVGRARRVGLRLQCALAPRHARRGRRRDAAGRLRGRR